MYSTDMFSELRAANLRAHIPTDDSLGLAAFVGQLVDIDMTHHEKFPFTCRHLARRLIPDDPFYGGQRIEEIESDVAVRINALADLGILRCVEERTNDGGDMLPTYQLVDN